MRSEDQKNRPWFRRSWGILRSLLSNLYFWGGLAALAVVGVLLYVLINNVVMPAYTRHDVAVTVPDVVRLPYEQARDQLAGQDLVVERVDQRFNPNVPRDVVIDQNPPPNALVKPGRHIYLTVNSGEARMVNIPSLGGMSLREAMNRLQAAGLRVEDTRPDSIPSPYPNTVTRQEPAPGDSLPEGAGVVLWYSTGLGDAYVTVPDVTGLTVPEARQVLYDENLRSVLIGGEEGEDVSEEIVQRQSREPGTRVREGFEIRIYLGAEEAAAPPPLEEGTDTGLN